MFHKILVAIDSSEIGQHVFDEALALAEKIDGHLMLLHVLSPFDEQYLNPVFIEPAGVYPSLHSEALNHYVQQWEGLKKNGEELLAILAKDAIASGVKVEYTQNFGDPGRTICDFARNWQADMIIVGRRGRSGFSEFFLGSVSNYVLHHAPCSVLTVQGKPVVTEEVLAQETATSC
jgi:nucleotide-binding universal stress UspA family protein